MCVGTPTEMRKQCETELAAGIGCSDAKGKLSAENADGRLEVEWQAEAKCRMFESATASKQQTLGTCQATYPRNPSP